MKKTNLKIGTKLIIVIAVLFAVIITASVAMVYLTMSNVMRETYVEDAVTSTRALENKVDTFNNKARDYSNKMATDLQTVSAMVAKANDKVLVKLNEYLVASGATTGLVFDTAGKVTISGDVRMKGVDLSKLSVVADAIKGTTSVSIEETKDIPYSVVGAAPIRSGTGTVLGGVLYTYSLVDFAMVDELKASNGSEFTIFKGDVRVNTTIENGGERAVGTQASAEVAEKVLKRGERVESEIQLFGKTHMCVYSPLRDIEQNIVGMVFSGRDIEYILKTEKNGLFASIILAVIMLVISAGIVVILIRKLIANPLKKIVKVVNEIEVGELGLKNPKYKLIKAKSNDEIGELSTQLAKTVERLRSYISEINYVLKEIVKGNLNVKAEGEYKGDFIEIKYSLNSITKDMKAIIGEIELAGVQVSAGADKVAQGSQELASGADQQTSEVINLANYVAEISSKITATAETASKATSIANLAGVGVDTSNEQMKYMTQAMEEINGASDEISKIIKTIEDIAFQTNILALNAAVEAARAGTAGKGFAVVADEVRNLAQKSAVAASQTTGLIENSVRAVQNGTEIADETAKSLRDVVVNSKKVVELINEIAAEAQSQASAVTDINSSVSVISEVISQTSAAAQDSAAAAEELSGQSAMLHQKISHFKIENRDDQLI